MAFSTTPRPRCYAACGTATEPSVRAMNWCAFSKPHELGNTVTSAEADGGFAIPAGLRPWIDAQSEERYACTTDWRNHVVGDPDDVELTDTLFTPTPEVPSEAAMVEAATRLIARLVDILSARHGPETAGRHYNSRARCRGD